MANDAETDQSNVLNLMSEENLAQRVQHEMAKRGWSQERMAREMTEAGHPLHQSAISKIVRPKDGKRRAISVDDAIGFAKVFGIPFEDLLIPLEAVWDHEWRESLVRVEEIMRQREALDREAAALVTRMVRIAQAGGEEFFDEHLVPTDPAAQRRLLDEMHRWGRRLINQIDAGVLEGLSDEEVLDRLRRITNGERFDEGARP